MAMLLDQHRKDAGITSTRVVRARIMRARIMRASIVRVEIGETGSVRVIYISAAATIFMMIRPVLIIAAVITACKDEYFASMCQQSGGA